MITPTVDVVLLALARNAHRLLHGIKAREIDDVQQSDLRPKKRGRALDVSRRGDAGWREIDREKDAFDEGHRAASVSFVH